MGCCVSQKIDMDKYCDFHEEPVPTATNECDEQYINLIGDTATFGCGHFWNVQAAFSIDPGVIRTRVGYTGGITMIKDFPDPDSIADHIEVVDIEYDPTKTTYNKLLERFWSVHDPTKSNERMYHSKIFYHDKQQKRIAEDALMDYDREVSKRNKPGMLKRCRTDVFAIKHIFLAKPENQHYFLQQDEFLMKVVNSSNPQQLMYSHLATKLNGFLSGYGTLTELNEQAGDFALKPDVIAYLRDKIESGIAKSEMDMRGEGW